MPKQVEVQMPFTDSCPLSIEAPPQYNLILMQSTEPDRISETYYRSPSHSNRRGPAPEYEQPYPRDFSADNSKYQRLSSEHSIKHERRQFQEQPGRAANRRQNHVINNLRNQLQSMKSEVAKLISSDSPIKMKIGSGEQLKERIEKLEHPSARVDRFMDNSSTSSFTWSRAKAKPRLEMQRVVDKQKFFELENQLLKTELKNLKNKYVLRKNQWKQQKEALQKKIFLLEAVIARHEQEALQYKEQIENQIATIREDMINKISTTGQPVFSQDLNGKLVLLEKQNNQLQQEVLYLRKRTIQANEQIKKMAIENNQLSSMWKRERRGVDVDEVEQMKLEYSKKIREREDAILARDEQISQMIKKQEIANEVVKKNTELIEILDRERQRCRQLEMRAEQSHQGPAKLQNDQQLNNAQRKYQQLAFQYHSLTQRNASLQSDLSELGNRLTNLKIQNQELRLRLQSKGTAQRQIRQEESVGGGRGVEDLQVQNQKLSIELNQMKGYISQMVSSTAQKMNQMEMQNGIFANRIMELERQNYDLKNQSSQHLATEASSSDQGKRMRRVEELQSWKFTLQQTLQAKEREIGSLRNQLKKFAQLYSTKCKQFQETQSNYSKQFQAEIDKQSYLNSLIANLNNKLQQQTAIYNQTITELKQQLQIVSKTQNQEFEVSQLRGLAQSNSSEIQKLRESIAAYKFALDNLESKMEMEKLKLISQRKSIQQSFQSEIKSLRNQLNLSTRTIDSMYSKLKSLSDELFKREQLIAQYMCENGIEACAQELARQYRQACDVSRVRQNLQVELMQIQRLTNDNITLMRHITRLQEQAGKTGTSVSTEVYKQGNRLQP